MTSTVRIPNINQFFCSRTSDSFSDGRGPAYNRQVVFLFGLFRAQKIPRSHWLVELYGCNFGFVIAKLDSKRFKLLSLQLVRESTSKTAAFLTQAANTVREAFGFPLERLVAVAGDVSPDGGQGMNREPNATSQCAEGAVQGAYELTLEHEQNEVLIYLMNSSNWRKILGRASPAVHK